MNIARVPRRTVLKSLVHAGMVMAADHAFAGADGAPRLDAGSGPGNGVAPKFNSDGVAAHWPGNSIICHVDKRSENFMALLDIHSGLMRSGLTHRIAVLPPASYHMTIFNGISYPARRSAFPADIPRDASERFCNEWFLSKLKKFDLGCDLPFRLRARPAAMQTNLYNILFEPVDEAENRKIRTLRDRLALALNYRLPDHDTYAFHITLNYFYSKMSRDEEQRFTKLHRELAGEFVERAPVIELQNPEYVYFDGMYEFRPQLLLENKGRAG